MVCKEQMLFIEYVFSLKGKCYWYKQETQQVFKFMLFKVKQLRDTEMAQTHQMDRSVTLPGR